MLPGPHPCPGRTGCRRKKKNEKDVPLPGGDSQLGLSPLPLEGCSVSDVSMAEEGPLQCDSDVIIEEEKEESMETDASLDSAAPTLKEKAIPEDLEAEVNEDCCSQTSEESTDQNLPHDSGP